MKYTIYRQGNNFCLGIKYPTDFEGIIGEKAFYWNPKKKCFQKAACDCWSDYKREDEVFAEFFRKIVLMEKK